MGGMAALSAMEAVATGKDDKPEREIKLLQAVVLQNFIEAMKVCTTSISPLASRRYECTIDKVYDDR